jgi:IS6 family transposase
VYRALEQFGQVIDVFVAVRPDATAARRFFERAIGATKTPPTEVVTDLAPVYPAVLEGLLPVAWHRTERYVNNRVEADYGRVKARLRPMRGLTTWCAIGGVGSRDRADMSRTARHAGSGW